MLPTNSIATQKNMCKQSAKLMGNIFEFTIADEDEAFAIDKIKLAIAEVQRIEALLTTYHKDSVVSHINEQAGVKPVYVPTEIFALTQRSQKIASITDGAFDLSYGSADKRLWNFDRTMQSLPDSATAARMARLINYKNILLDENDQTIMLKEKGMRIGFGGIGKGYAAEKVKALLLQEGVNNALVNASGDLTAWGMADVATPWMVGIGHPDEPAFPFASLNISGRAIATSGNYEKYVMINGKKYSHTINPKTGMPVTGVKSVSIISPDAEIADALATPVTIMGVRTGLDFINQLSQVECIIIDDDNKIFTSANINLQ